MFALSNGEAEGAVLPSSEPPSTGEGPPRSSPLAPARLSVFSSNGGASAPPPDEETESPSRFSIVSTNAFISTPNLFLFFAIRMPPGACCEMFLTRFVAEERIAARRLPR